MVLWCGWLLPRWRIDPKTKTIKKEKKKTTNTKRRSKTRTYLNKFAEYFGLLILVEWPEDHLPALENFISSMQIKANKRWR